MYDFQANETFRPLAMSLPRRTATLPTYADLNCDGIAIGAALPPKLLEAIGLQGELAEKQRPLREAVAASRVSINLADECARSVEPILKYAQPRWQMQVLNQAHWIAHPALPIGDLVGLERDPQIVGNKVVEYVGEHAEDIYAILAASFSQYSCGSDTKEFAFELLDDHRRRHFRSIVRAVFPEIERCCREALGLGARKGSKQVIDDFKKKFGKLGPSDISSLHGYYVYSMMVGCFYQSIDPEKDLEPFSNMINRHASQHGLIRYESMRDTLNAIFLFDFILKVCDALKKS
jgi:hypothetical protein